MRILKTSVLAEGFYFLVSPRWRDGHLWISDMAGRKIYRVAADGTVEVVAEVPLRPSGLGFLPDGKLLAVSMTNRSVLRLENGLLTTHCDLSSMVTGELSEMTVDRHGRAYVGTFDWTGSGSRCFEDARMVLISPNGVPRIVGSNFALPNGCVITQDGKHLILAETFAHQLTIFDIGEDGNLTGRRLLADLGKVSPDGLCIDSEGGIWVAAARQPLFIRLFGGRITHAVKVPHRHAVACALGGTVGSTLFCLTVSEDFEDIDDWSATARVETTQVEIGCAVC